MQRFFLFALVASITYSLDEQFVMLDSDKERLVTLHEAVIADDGQVHMQQDEIYDPFGVYIMKYKDRVTYEIDACGVITTYGSHCYYHWLLQVVPRLALLLAAGYTTIPVHCGVISRSFQKEWIELLGLTDRVIQVQKGDVVCAKECIVPDLPFCLHVPFTLDTPHCIRPFKGWQLDFLREVMSSWYTHVDMPAYQYIYISQKHASKRRLLNEKDLVSMLQNYGFEEIVLENYSVVEQAFLFAHADIIVASHGAGLANCAFLRAGAHVIELDSLYGPWDLYKQLVEIVHGVYHHVDSSFLVNNHVIRTDIAETMHIQHADMYVDVQGVQKSLEEIIERKICV